MGRVQDGLSVCLGSFLAFQVCVYGVKVIYRCVLNRQMVDAVWPSMRDGTPPRGNRARARAHRRSVGRWSRPRPLRGRLRAFAFVRSFVRSFVRQREDVLNRIESKSTPVETRIGRRSTVRSRDTARWGFWATRARRIGERGTTVGAID